MKIIWTFRSGLFDDYSCDRRFLMPNINHIVNQINNKLVGGGSYEGKVLFNDRFKNISKLTEELK